jgi:predicted DNA repair protein MutK
MKTLSIAGTVAMFMVGGSILMHGIPGWHHVVEGLEHAMNGTPKLLISSAKMLLDAVAGLIAGAIILVVVTLATKVYKAARAA